MFNFKVQIPTIYFKNQVQFQSKYHIQISVTMLNLSFLTPKILHNNLLHISDKQTNRQTNLVTGSLIELLIAAKHFEKQFI